MARQESLAAIQRWLGPDWRRLADEFLADPLGPHGPSLQWLLVLLRRADNGLDLVLVQVGHGRWALAERRREGAPVFLDLPEFTSLADAEREAFRRRVRALVGTVPWEEGRCPA